MRMRLGELLVQRGLITPESLGEALQIQQRRGMKLGTALIRLGRITEKQLVQALAELLRVPVADVRRSDPDAVKAVSARFASEHELMPLRIRNERGRRVLTVAMSDPTDVSTIDELSFMTNARIEVELATSSAIDAAIRGQWGTRFGARPSAHDGGPLKLALDDGPSGHMTILRRGGGEDRIDTAARPNPAPKKAEEQETYDEEEAILLTQTVDGRDPKGQFEVPTSGNLGALVDASGRAIDAEVVMKMEKRFWALMRVLARKGLVTKEDFLRELDENGSSSS